MDGDAVTLAEAVREACLRTLLSAYEEAGMSGLCAEGRLEYAVGAVRGLDLQALAETQDAGAEHQADGNTSGAQSA